MQESRVRLATAADVNDIHHLIREAHEEECVIPLRFDANSVFHVLLRAMAGNAVIGVIDGDSEIESACYLSVAKPWYSDTSIVNCTLFFTRQDYRKSTNSKALLTWARNQAERLNCALQVETPTIEQSKPKFALFERVLGAPAGMSWVYKPHPEAPTELQEVEVEPASLKDEGDIINVARELGTENSAYHIDESVAIPMLRDALDGNGVIGIIRGPDREIQGTIFLRISTPWFSSDPFADEYFVFVPARFRKSPNAKSLIQFAKRQADRLNLPLRIGIISKIELSRKLALYTRVLGSPQNSLFICRTH